MMPMMPRPARTAVVLLGLAALLAGCVPRLGPQPALKPVEQLAASRTLVAKPAPWPEAGWWRAYGDPQLDTLIAEALAGSPDIAMAAARLGQARGTVDQVRAPLIPSIGAEASARVEKQSYNMGFPVEFVPHGWNSTGHAGLNLRFDLDLWGRTRALLAAATGEAEALRVDTAQTALMLSTAVASDYAALAGLFLQRDVAERAVAIHQEMLTLTAERYRVGLDNQAPEELARARLAASRIERDGIDAEIGHVRNRLAALTGHGPDRGLDIARPVLTATTDFGLPSNLPLDLLGRRPDIVAARLRAEAAGRRIKAARAAYYPDVNLVGLVGFQSLGLSHLVDQGSKFGHVGPALTLPLLGGTYRRGALRHARASYDLAVGGYDATLLTALREVADAVTALRTLSGQQQQSAEALAAAEQAHRIAQQRFRGGLSTYLDALTAEDVLLERRRSDAVLRSRTLVLNMTLVRTLGGGFSMAQVQGGTD